MRLTLRKAKDLCIELWTWLAKTGKGKRNWPGWEKYGFARNVCWFCEYVKYRNLENKTHTGCRPCPLYSQSHNNGCYDFAYRQWENATTTDGRKKCAKLFLEEIEAL